MRHENVVRATYTYDLLRVTLNNGKNEKSQNPKLSNFPKMSKIDCCDFPQHFDFRDFIEKRKKKDSIAKMHHARALGTPADAKGF